MTCIGARRGTRTTRSACDNESGHGAMAPRRSHIPSPLINAPLASRIRGRLLSRACSERIEFRGASKFDKRIGTDHRSHPAPTTSSLPARTTRRTAASESCTGRRLHEFRRERRGGPCQSTYSSSCSSCVSSGQGRERERILTEGVPQLGEYKFTWCRSAYPGGCFTHYTCRVVLTASVPIENAILVSGSRWPRKCMLNQRDQAQQPIAYEQILIMPSSVATTNSCECGSTWMEVMRSTCLPPASDRSLSGSTFTALISSASPIPPTPPSSPAPPRLGVPLPASAMDDTPMRAPATDNMFDRCTPTDATCAHSRADGRRKSVYETQPPGGDDVGAVRWVGG